MSSGLASINQVKQIARNAGKAVMKRVRRGLKETFKDDTSPVTNADKKSHEIIKKALHKLTPGIPIMSEEDPSSHTLAGSVKTFWCVDPVDSTRSMIRYSKGEKERDGFAINIGLVENGRASKGVVYYPARDTLFYTGNNGKAYKQVGSAKPEQLIVQDFTVSDDKPLRAAVSHKSASRPETICGKDYTPIPEVGGGRAFKVLTGEADLAHIKGFAYWDMAAAHAISKAAGANAINANTKQEVTYDAAHPAVPDTVLGHLDSIMRL